MSDVRPGFFIDGELVDESASGATVALVSPSTEEVFAEVPAPGEHEMDRAVAAARSAFDEGDWPRMPTKERVDVILRAMDLLEPRLEEAARVQTDEMGGPITLTRMTGSLAVGVVRAMCAEVLEYEEVDRRSGQWDYEVRSEPYGVVATLSPWNGPFPATVMKGATALLAGCTVVDKPPPEAPISSLQFAAALKEAGLPDGAFNLVAAGGELGERLVSSPHIDLVSFTGGTAVGRQVGRICGEHLKRVILELGGKSPGVVLEDGDIDTAAEAVAAGVFYNSGQVCSSLTRLLVPRARHDEAVEALVARAEAMRLGDPHDESTQLGPIATERQRDRVEGYVWIGVEEGARLACGGERPAHLPRGWYVTPTVFGEVSNSMRLAREEIFGPVATVIPYDDEDEALRIANDSPYGLNASVFSADEERAASFALGLRVGAVALNAYTTNYSAPRYHIKASGVGVRTGREGYEQHRLGKVINLRPTDAAYRTSDLIDP